MSEHLQARPEPGRVPAASRPAAVPVPRPAPGGDVLSSEVRLVGGAEEGTFRAVYSVAADEFALQGHYPGFPILPGVLVVECVRRACLLSAGARLGRLQRIESVRFDRPVRPGDELDVEARWLDGPGGSGVSATVRTAGGRAATVVLRFGEGAVPC